MTGTILLVRHGQASFGEANYDALSPRGVEQARLLGQALKARLPRVDAVYTGTMRRHLETAGASCAAMALELSPREEPGLNEYDHEELLVRYRPAWADRRALLAELAQAADPKRAFQRLFGEAVARWASGLHDHEYAESWGAFSARVEGALERIIAALGPDKIALVFTSGGAIGTIVQRLLHTPTEQAFRLTWGLANAGVTKLFYSDKGRYLSTLNEHAHLELAGPEYVTFR